MILSVVVYKAGISGGVIPFVMGLLACVAVILMVAGGERRFGRGMDFFAKYTMPIFLMHTLFAAPIRSVLLKLGIGSSVIHVVLGLGISFIGPIIAAWISGKYEFGYNVTIGYFDQQMALLDSNKTVIDDFYAEFPDLTQTEIRNSLASFMFYGEDVFKEIRMLSGGEKVRLQLCKILKKGPNLLILDEPTNHMDIIGKESLENLLQNYDGTVIFVSHDRFFVNKISDCLLIFEKNKVTYYDGKYEEYEANKKDEEQDVIIEKKKDKAINNTYLMQKEKNKMLTKVKKLERDIELDEKQIDTLNEKLSKEEIYTNYEKVQEIQNEINVLNENIKNNMELWESLQEKLEE